MRSYRFVYVTCQMQPLYLGKSKKSFSVVKAYATATDVLFIKAQVQLFMQLSVLVTNSRLFGEKSVLLLANQTLLYSSLLCL